MRKILNTLKEWTESINFGVEKKYAGSNMMVKQCSDDSSGSSKTLAAWLREK